MFRIAFSRFCSRSQPRGLTVSRRIFLHDCSRFSPLQQHVIVQKNIVNRHAFSTSADEDPDYAGPEGRKWRAEAQKFAEERHTNLSAATKAFEANEKEKAKELSEKGKEAGKKMIEANAKAAEVILQRRNGDKPETYLDLHGLYLEEALTAFRSRLAKLQASQSGNDIVFEVVPGAGNHSKDEAIIKPKVIEELKGMGFSFEEKNAGTLLVTIPAGSAPIASPIASPTTAGDKNHQEKKRDKTKTGGGGGSVTWVVLGSLVAAIAYLFVEKEAEVIAVVEKAKEAAGLNKK
jgi:DNA-nicking Smr family endonuclease